MTVETDESPRNPSTESLRSNTGLASDRESELSDSATRDDESGSTNTSAENVSSWRLAIPGLALSLGIVPFAVCAALLAPPQPASPGDANVFDLRCNDDPVDPIEQRFALDMTFGSLTSGSLTFAQAKTIDVVWDTVVGQGGRLLHGWILYRYVLHPLLVVLMERFTVTADFYMAVSFSGSSFETLWTLLAFIFRRGSITVFLCTLMVIYALGYTLFFSVIWGAATGYVGLSQNFYPMPNGDVIGLNSRDLSLCWALDGTRIGLSGRVIELGPSFEDVGGLTKALLLDNTTSPRTKLCIKETQDVYQTLYYTASGWRQARTAETVWDYFTLRGDATSIWNSSFNFKSIRDYALTAQTLRMAVGQKHWEQGPEAKIANFTETQSLNSTRESWWRHLFACSYSSTPFTGLGFAPSIESPQYSSIESTAAGIEVEFPPDNQTGKDNGIDRAFWKRFIRDTSVPIGQNTPSVLPYNSTIWLNGTSIQLAAPFLDVGHGCFSPSLFTGLGNCVCYKGDPIPPNLITNERAVCRTGPSSAWGFSSFLTRLGFGLEGAWVACCAACYGVMLASSGILRKRLIWTTSTRRAALAFSRAVSDGKGEGLDQLSEAQLASRLKGILLGYPQQASLNSARGDGDTSSDTRLVPNPPHREHGLTDFTNAGVEKAKQKLKSSTRNNFRKRKPSSTEVYEDLNWRVYDRV